MTTLIKYTDYIIYWLIILLPFSIAISNAPMNIFMVALIVFFLTKKILKKEPLFSRTPINTQLWLLFAITCVSLLHSVDLKDTIKGGILRMLQYIFIFHIMAAEVKDKKHIWKILLAISIGISFVSLDAIWQVFTGKDLVRDYPTIINIGLVRATASFKDANTFGIYLSAVAPLIFGLSLYYLRGAKRIAFVLASILVLAGIALTYSRPTLLATYMALLCLGIMGKNKVLTRLLIIFILISPFILPKSVKNWAKEVKYNPIRFMCNDDRIAIFLNSIRMIKDHPLIGLGANTYMKNYKNYKYAPQYRDVGTSDYLYAHNNFLHMAAEIGLTGLGIFLWLLYKIFKECNSIYKGLKDTFLKNVSLSLLACIIAFLVNGLTESSLYSSRVAVIFWYLTGFSLGLKKFINADR